MTVLGSSSRPRRPASPTGRLLTLAVIILTLPFALVWIVVASLLLAFRPLIVVPLSLATVGGSVVGGWFAYTGQWPDAAQAVVVAAVAGALLIGFVALADRAGFDGRSDARSLLPPWWWYF